MVLVVLEIFERWKALLDDIFLGLGAARKRIHTDVYFAELPAAARLLFVAIAALGVGLNCLAERNLGRLGIDIQLVAAVQPLANDLQVQLAHAGRDQLLRLRVTIEPERGILLDNLV